VLFNTEAKRDFYLINMYRIRKLFNLQESILRLIEMMIPIGLFLMKKKGDNTIITFIIGMVCVISYSTVAFGMSIPYVFFRHYLMQNDPLWVMIFIFAELSTIVYYIYAIQEKSIRTKLEFLCLTLSFIFSILWLFVDSMSKNPAYSDIFMVQLFGILWCSISIFGVGKALLRTYDRFINYGEMNDNK